MRILHVTMQFGRVYSQGTERYIETLSACLRERGHEVACLAGDPLRLDTPRKLGAAVDGEGRVLAYPTRGWMSVVGLPPNRLEGWLREYRPDVVHLNTPAHIGIGCAMAARRLSIPYVVTVHDYWWICPKATLIREDGRLCDGSPPWPTCIRCVAGDHPRAWVRSMTRLPALFGGHPKTDRLEAGPTQTARLEAGPTPVLGWALALLPLGLYFAKAALRGMSPADMRRWMHRRPVLRDCLDSAGFVIFPSQTMARTISPHLRHDRWKAIPNGLTPEWFASPRPPAATVKPPEELTIGYAGAMASHKAPHLLLEAIRLLGWRQTRVRLAGAAGERVYWRRLQEAAAGLNVEFMGQVDREAMPGFLRSLDILAITSICPENFPYIVLEAQAAGVPVIGSNVGGIPERIPDKRMRFRPGSAEGLAAAMEHARGTTAEVRLPPVPTAGEMLNATETVYQQVTGAEG